MSNMPDHAKPPAKRDHLWVLFIIAACAMLELVASWVTIGAMSGFPRIGGRHGLPTDWVLAVIAEAFWGYALWAWLAGAAGRRSRNFAMGSAALVFTLSLIGQGAAHLVTPGTKPPAALVVFITDLPVIVVALIAILIHLRQTDREEAIAAERAAAAERERVARAEAAADERTALRAALGDAAERERALRADLAEVTARAEDAEAARAQADTDRSARETAEAERDEAVSVRQQAEARAEAEAAKAERLTRKLDAVTGRKRGSATGRKRGAATARKPEPVTGPATAPPEMPEEEAPDDLDSEAKVLWYIEKGKSASAAGIRAGLTDSRGRQIARKAKELSEEAPRDIVDGKE